MKPIAKILIMTAAVMVVGAAASAEEPWLDPVNCDMCKIMTTEEGLLEHMTCEVYPTATGMIWMNMVPADYLDAYRRVNMNMEKAGQEMMSGKEMHLCGSCQSMGSLMMSGAQMDKVDTKEGCVMLLTSADAEVVKKIQAHAEHTAMEFEKMAASMEQGHEGHGHE